MIQDKETGLILPDHVAREKSEVVQETWLYDTIKKIRYAAKEMDTREVDMTLSCRRCGKPLQLEAATETSGKLVCDCKVRTIR